MKHFTFEWWSGECPDNGAADAYWQYIKSVKARFPALVQSFITDCTLHDSRLLRLEVETEKKELRIYLHGFDMSFKNQLAYEPRYKNVIRLLSFGNTEQPLGGPGGYGDLGYDEFEILDSGFFAHRLLFSTGIEIHIEFDTFEYTANTIEADDTA